MNQSTEPSNTSSVQPERHLPLTLVVGSDSRVYEQAHKSVSHLADALACAAVSTDLQRQLDGAQQLLWVAVQIRTEPSPIERRRHLADALELVADGFSVACSQERYESGAQYFRPSVFQHACETAVMVSALMRGILAQVERDRAAIAQATKGGANE